MRANLIFKYHNAIFIVYCIILIIIYIKISHQNTHNTAALCVFLYTKNDKDTLRALSQETSPCDFYMASSMYVYTHTRARTNFRCSA